MAGPRSIPVRTLLLVCSLVLACLLGWLLWAAAVPGENLAPLSAALAGLLFAAGVVGMLAALWIGGAQAPVDYTSPTFLNVTPLYDAVDSPEWRRKALGVQDDQAALGALGILLVVLGGALYASPLIGAVGLVLAVGGMLALAFWPHPGRPVRPR